MKRGGL